MTSTKPSFRRRHGLAVARYLLIALTLIAGPFAIWVWGCSVQRSHHYEERMELTKQAYADEMKSVRSFLPSNDGPNELPDWEKALIDVPNLDYLNTSNPLTPGDKLTLAANHYCVHSEHREQLYPEYLTVKEFDELWEFANTWNRDNNDPWIRTPGAQEKNKELKDAAWIEKQLDSSATIAELWFAFCRSHEAQISWEDPSLPADELAWNNPLLTISNAMIARLRAHLLLGNLKAFQQELPLTIRGILAVSRGGREAGEGFWDWHAQMLFSCIDHACRIDALTPELEETILNLEPVFTQHRLKTVHRSGMRKLASLQGAFDDANGDTARARELWLERYYGYSPRSSVELERVWRDSADYVELYLDAMLEGQSEVTDKDGWYGRECASAITLVALPRLWAELDERTWNTLFEAAQSIVEPLEDSDAEGFNGAVFGGARDAVSELWGAYSLDRRLLLSQFAVRITRALRAGHSPASIAAGAVEALTLLPNLPIEATLSEAALHLRALPPERDDTFFGWELTLPLAK